MSNSPNFIYFLIIGIVVFGFILDRILEGLNASWRQKPIPSGLQGIYDQEKYLKQQSYAKVTDRFSMLTSSISFLLSLLFLGFDGFNWLNQLLLPNISHPILLGLAFFATLFLIVELIEMPFDWYATFVIEEEFGFNKTTPKIYVTDKLKGYLIGAILGTIFYGLLFQLNVWFPKTFWLYVWAAIALFMVLLSMFYSNIIVPIFNKQKPLPDGELKEAIFRFSDKVGFKVKDIYEIDGSKRSTRANAYFTGLGRYKRIVLYDTLIQELTVDEIVAVLAHEMGHNKKKHTLISLITSLVQMGIMLFIMAIFINNPLLSEALGSESHFFHLGLIAFALLYSPISTIIGLVMNLLSRSNEYQADAYACQHANGESLVSALKKLASNNLSNLTPHPAYVFVNYSHPDLWHRVIRIKKHGA
ncbi:MAG: M48 family metallopeptidase [Salinivirgaceae bacterium]|nr:M48 family metallopeptidase [Salinivirgaceae bacterium]